MKVDLKIDDVHFHVEGTLTECLVALESMGFCEVFSSENDPVWDEIPEEYNWLAMDEEGKWYVYRQKPELQCDYWYEFHYEGLEYFTNIKPNFNGDWKDSLMRRPT